MQPPLAPAIWSQRSAILGLIHNRLPSLTACRYPRIAPAGRLRLQALLLLEQLHHLLHDRSRRRVDLTDELLHVVTRYRRNFKSRLSCLCQKLRIGHRLKEGCAQDHDAVLWHIRRGHERIGDLLTCEHQLEDIALLLGLRQVDDQRDIAQIRMLGQCELNQQVDFLARDPVWSGGLDARPRPPATTADLTAFHRQKHSIAAAVTSDEPHLSAERTIDDFAELIGIGAAMSDHQLLCEHVVESPDAARVPGHAKADFVASAADPRKSGRIKLRRSVAEQRFKGGGTVNDAKT